MHKLFYESPRSLKSYQALPVQEDVKTMLYKRTLESKLKQISITYPVLLLTGPRQVGKSTLLSGMIDNDRTIVSLDNPTLRALAKSDPELFLQRYAPPIMIDEVQYAPELFEFIKISVDKHKRCGDYWLTGSQMFQIMELASESLAGRVGIAHMLGLSNSEIEGTLFPKFTVDPQELIERVSQAKPRTIRETYERIFKGSMPRLYEREDVEREGYFESYLETYVSRDIKPLAQVADELSFLRFIRIVAARTATNVNYDTLANEADISAPTAKRWLSILVSTGLVALIEPFSHNALKRVIKAPRMYFLDTGLCAHLTRWMSPEALEAGAASGAFFETWVVSELYKSYLNNGKRPPLFFYRDSNKKEIDVIIYQDNTDRKSVV